MSRVKTFTNGGDLIPADLNAIQDDYEPAFSIWRPVQTIQGDLPENSTTRRILHGPGIALSSGAVLGATSSALGNVGTANGLIYLDPADFAAGPRGVRLRLRAATIVNDVALTQPILFELLPVTAFAGAGTPDEAARVQTVGATLAFAMPAAPAANAATVAAGDGVILTTAGFYVIGCTPVASSVPSNCAVKCIASVQCRQV